MDGSWERKGVAFAQHVHTRRERALHNSSAVHTGAVRTLCTGLCKSAVCMQGDAGGCALWSVRVWGSHACACKERTHRKAGEVGGLGGMMEEGSIIRFNIPTPAPNFRWFNQQQRRRQQQRQGQEQGQRQQHQHQQPQQLQLQLQRQQQPRLPLTNTTATIAAATTTKTPTQASSSKQVFQFVGEVHTDPRRGKQMYGSSIAARLSSLQPFSNINICLESRPCPALPRGLKLWCRRSTEVSNCLCEAKAAACHCHGARELRHGHTRQPFLHALIFLHQHC